MWDEPTRFIFQVPQLVPSMTYRDWCNRRVILILCIFSLGENIENGTPNQLTGQKFLSMEKLVFSLSHFLTPLRREKKKKEGEVEEERENMRIWEYMLFYIN